MVPRGALNRLTVQPSNKPVGIVYLQQRNQIYSIGSRVVVHWMITQQCHSHRDGICIYIYPAEWALNGLTILLLRDVTLTSRHENKQHRETDDYSMSIDLIFVRQSGHLETTILDLITAASNRDNANLYTAVMGN